MSMTLNDFLIMYHVSFFIFLLLFCSRSVSNPVPLDVTIMWSSVTSYGAECRTILSFGTGWGVQEIVSVVKR